MELRDMARSARPWLLGAMTALFVARPLFPSEAAASQGDGLSVVMLWIVLAICWLLSQVAQREFRLRFGWIDAAVVLLVCWHSTAAVWAVWHGSPRPAINMLWQWVALGLSFLLARQLIETAAERRALVTVMISLGVALSAYGFYQRAYEMPATRAVYQADPDAALRQAGFWFPPGSPQREMFEIRLMDDEPTATFALTNSLAGFLAPWLVVGVGAMLLGRGMNRPRDPWRLLVFAGCMTLVGVCLLLTNSRSGVLAAAAGLLLVVAMRQNGLRKFGWKIPTAGATVVVIAIAAATAAGLLAPAWKSLAYRAEYWQASMQMIAERPLLGCGPGNFQYEYPRFKLPQASEEIADPHNFIVELWATAGTPAMLAMLAVLFFFFWKSRPQAADENTEDGNTEDEKNGRHAHTRVGMKAEAGKETTRPRKRGHGSRGLGNRFPDGAQLVLAGAVCGFMVAWPLGMISSAPPSNVAFALGFPMAAVCVAASYRWIVEGSMPRQLPAVGVLVLLINLSAAGGIGLPGVAGSLWLLLAIGMPRCESRRLGLPLAVCGLLATLVLAAACYFTAYAPVLGCRLQMQLAHQKWLEMKVSEHLVAAAEADPLAPQPWRSFAALTLARWSETQEDADYLRFEKCNGKAVELAANSPLAWRTAGGLYLEASQKALWPDTEKEAIERAVMAFGRAVELYPNSGQYRADLALAMRESGDMSGFEKQRKIALELDRLTPHSDKKIDEETKKELIAVQPRK